MSIFEAVVIAIVEGITEFLPISSTGHMIITESFLGTHGDFVKLFTVAIQFGAILAVVVLYWKKFLAPLTAGGDKWKFYLKLIVGVIPALVLGFLFNDAIEALLESPLTVAISLLLGGIVLVFIDRFFNRPVVEKDEELGYGRAFMIGLWQVIAMIPGVSRSAASIIGGMQQKLTRKLAAEFSFYLAVPTMFAATAYSVFLKKWNSNGIEKKGYELILESSQNIVAFVVGNVVAFAVALVAIRFFISYLQRHGFRVFGWYRIIAGVILLALLFTGYLK
ncbi:MAG: undecaprenyl-diphosphate phosphatase [Flavisolibacter sp.]